MSLWRVLSLQVRETQLDKCRSVLTPGTDRGRQAAGLDVHPGEVEVLVAVRVPAPGELEHAQVPVRAVAARARADGGHGQLEGVCAGGVPESNCVGAEVDFVGD